MSVEFKLPDIGEGIAEGEIVQWLVKLGDTVEEHQPVVEVMTDKATVEVPAPTAGRITELRAKAGEVVPVGSVIFVLEAGSGAAVAAAPPAPPAPKAAASAPPAAAPANKPVGAVAASKPPAAATAPAPVPAPAPAAAPARAAAGRLEFKLPDIGEGIAEGEIVRWIVQAGDSVAEHQAVVEVMTDKATVEVPAPAAGRIVELRAEAGQVVPVGAVIFVLETEKSAAASAAAPIVAATAPARTAALPLTPEPAAALPAPAPEAVAVARHGNGRVLAVPSARRRARELGIDLTAVTGSGRSGVVRRRDVEQHSEQQRSTVAQQPPAAPSRPAQPVSIAVGARETRTPFRGVRRKIAEAMTRSKFTATHFTVVEELDVTELVRVRAKAKEIGAHKGVNVTYMPFIMKAVASGLQRYPQLNAALDESTQEVVTYHYVHLGIATDTEQGLIVPVIRDVQTKGLLQLASELKELAERTRSGKVRPDELRGSTFSITNAGNIGGILATPIINFPEVAILGVHRIVKRPGVVETPDGDRIEVRQYMNLSLSVDHRLADGADGARFLVHLKLLLETPGLLSL